MKNINKTYDNFFTMSLAISATTVGFGTIGLSGVLLGIAATAGIVLTDKYLLGSKLSETRISILS